MVQERALGRSWRSHHTGAVATPVARGCWVARHVAPAGGDAASMFLYAVGCSSIESQCMAAVHRLALVLVLD